MLRITVFIESLPANTKLTRHLGPGYSDGSLL